MADDQAAALWTLEEQFWLGSADFYARALAAEALMVLPPPAGVLDRAATIESIREGTRWREVLFRQRRCVFPGPDTAVLVYLAQAERGDADASYTAQCSSVYLRDRGNWMLALHQQTPNQTPAGAQSCAAQQDELTWR